MTPTDRQLKAWLESVADRPRDRKRLWAKLNPAECLPLLVRLATSTDTTASGEAVRLIEAWAGKCTEFLALVRFREVLPERSRVLAGVRLRLTLRIARALPKSDLAHTWEGAAVLLDLSNSLRYAGTLEASGQAATESARLAVATCLRDQDPSESRTRVLAEAYITLSNRLSESGDTVGATQAALAASKACHSSATSPQADERFLWARIEAQLAERLLSQGLYDSALKRIPAILTALKSVPPSEAQVFDVASIKHTLSILYSQTGPHALAIQYGNDADQDFRVLAGRNPDAYSEYAAAASNTYANALESNGEHRTAYDVSLSTIERLTPLFRANPGRFRWDLAHCLIGHSQKAEHCGQFPQALAAALEARRILRSKELWKLQAITESHLAHLYIRRGELSKAARAAAANTKALEHLPVTDPETVAELFESLRTHADICRMSGRKSQRKLAVPLARRALALFDNPRMPNTDNAEFNRGIGYHTLAISHEAIGELAEAITATQAAAKSFKRLVSRSPKMANPHLASALYETARLLNLLNQHLEALPLVEKAIALLINDLENQDETLPGALGNACCVRSYIRQDLGDSPARSMVELTHAIRLVRPHFLKPAHPWKLTMHVLTARYFEVCDQAGFKYDGELVNEIAAVLVKELRQDGLATSSTVPRRKLSAKAE